METRKNLIAALLLACTLSAGIVNPPIKAEAAKSSVSGALDQIARTATDYCFTFGVCKTARTKARVTLADTRKSGGIVYMFDDISWTLKNNGKTKKVTGVKIVQHADGTPWGAHKNGATFLRNFSDGSALVKSSYVTKSTVGSFVGLVTKKSTYGVHTECVGTIWYRIYPNGYVAKHDSMREMRLVAGKKILASWVLD